MARRPRRSLPQALDAPLARLTGWPSGPNLAGPRPAAGVAACGLEKHLVAAADRVPCGPRAGSEPGALVTVLLHPLSSRNESSDGSARHGLWARHACIPWRHGPATLTDVPAARTVAASRAVTR